MVIGLRVEIALHVILLVVPIVCACPAAWGIGNPILKLISTSFLTVGTAPPRPLASAGGVAAGSKRPLWIPSDVLVLISPFEGGRYIKKE